MRCITCRIRFIESKYKYLCRMFICIIFGKLFSDADMKTLKKIKKYVG